MRQFVSERTHQKKETVIYRQLLASIPLVAVKDPFDPVTCGDPGSRQRIEHYRKLVEQKGKIFD